MSDGVDIERLRTRLERERRARRQAEVIAERAMRELWESNRQLQDLVARRTGQVERTLRSCSLIHQAWGAEILDVIGEIREGLGPTNAEAAASQLDRLARLTSVAPPVGHGQHQRLAPVVFADEVLERWQQPCARVGQLLSVDADPDAPEVEAPWDALGAVVDSLMSGLVGTRVPGAVAVTSSALGPLEVRIDHLGVPDMDVDGEQMADRSGRGGLGPALAAASHLVDEFDGALDVVDAADGWHVVVQVPTATSAS